MRQILLDNFAGLLAAIVTGLGGWLFGRKKLNAEANSMEAEAEAKEIDNGSKIVQLYKEAIDDLGTRYENKYKEVVFIYDRKIEILEAEIKLHKQVIANLKKENTELKQRIKELETSIPSNQKTKNNIG